MEKQLQFSETVTRKLRHYVYRLIDPRSGTTFYVRLNKEIDVLIPG